MAGDGELGERDTWRLLAVGRECGVGSGGGVQFGGRGGDVVGGAGAVVRCGRYRGGAGGRRGEGWKKGECWRDFEWRGIDVGINRVPPSFRQ